MVTQPDTHKKLTEGCPAVKKLRALFDEGKISKASNPKSVYESDPIFYTNHRLDPFRTRLNNLGKEYTDLCGMFIILFRNLQELTLHR